MNVRKPPISTSARRPWGTCPINLVARYVGDMDDLLAPDHALHRSAGPGPPRAILARPCVKFGMASDGCEMKVFAIVDDDVPAFRLTQPQGFFEHRIEDRGEIAGRGIDDLQYLCRRGLPLQRLVALGSAFGKLPLQIGYEPLAIG
jgi:hypothetical protein